MRLKNCKRVSGWDALRRFFLMTTESYICQSCEDYYRLHTHHNKKRAFSFTRNNKGFPRGISTPTARALAQGIYDRDTIA